MLSQSEFTRYARRYGYPEEAAQMLYESYYRVRMTFLPGMGKPLSDADLPKLFESGFGELRPVLEMKWGFTPKKRGFFARLFGR